MNKNRPMTRIDLDYLKELKYPDINDYLKDSMYASNLTDYPDNQRNSTVNFRAVSSTIALDQFTVGEDNGLVNVWIADIKLFGYNPEVEIVEKMELLIDFLQSTDATDEENTKVINIFKRGSTLNLDLVHNSEIQAQKLPPIVNFSVTFPKRAIVDIFNYVFGKRAALAKRYYTDASGQDTEESEYEMDDVEFREKFLDSAYRWEIPATLRYYNVDEKIASGYVGIEISLHSVLPQYRKQIELSSSKVVFNPSYSSTAFNLFKFSYSTNQPGRIRVKAEIVGDADSKQSEVSTREVKDENNASYLSDFYAFPYVMQQHSGFSVRYPDLKFTYDLYVSVDNKPELSNDLFDTFTASPFKIVNSLTINAVQVGNSVKRVDAATANPLVVNVIFTSKLSNIESAKERFKFRLEFLQKRSVTILFPDISSPIADIALDRTCIAGDFWGSVPAKRTTESAKSNARTNTTLYRVNATNVEGKKVLSVFQRLSVDNVLYHGNLLAECTVSVDLVDSTPATGATAASYRYRLTLTWPATLDKKALYNLIKARFVRLSISDVLQQVLAEGSYRRPFTDIYENNADNPLYTNLPGWRANYTVNYSRNPVWTGITAAEQANVNAITKGASFFVTPQCKVVNVANLTGTETKQITLLSYSPQTYVALSSTEPAKNKPSRPFFCLEGVAMASSQSVKNGVFGSIVFYPALAVPITEVRDVQTVNSNQMANAIDPLVLKGNLITVTVTPLHVINMIKKIIGAKSTLSSGIYSLYYIMNLNEVPDTESDIFTNLMNGTKQKTSVIFVIRHQVK